MKTGRPIVDPAREPKPGVKLDRVCPPDIGQKDWEPPAFSPTTGLLYVGVFNICMGLTDHEVSYIAGTPYDGMEMERFSVDGPDGNWGGLIAWDPAHGKKIWEIPEKFMVMSGVIATASNLVFYGTTDGWFRAVDAWTGKVLWSQKLGSGHHRPADHLYGPGQPPIRRRRGRRRRRRDGAEGPSRLPAARQHDLRLLGRRRHHPGRRRPICRVPVRASAQQ